MFQVKYLVICSSVSNCRSVLDNAPTKGHSLDIIYIYIYVVSKLLFFQYYSEIKFIIPPILYIERKGGLNYIRYFTLQG